ncbi:MAG TPA: DUF5655 domain-containing protein [Candidatus Angelobacter sp.]|jgi:hypothetical protein|nr:DUF5655 domain-containing protein [Candidatus Angelobacter sp.]
MPTPAKQKNSPSYDVHPSLGMYQSSLTALKQKTGRSLAEWVKFVNKEGPATEKERRAWLKEKYGMGMNYAGWIAEQSLGKGDDGTPETYLKHAEEYVEKMYSGAKETLRPIFDALLVLGRSMGADVKVCPCQTIVPLYRKHVFAQIKPTTRTRIDLGLALKDTKVPKRLIDTGGFAKKDRITHRIEITSLKDIDAEVKKWLKIAYEMDR